MAAHSPASSPRLPSPPPIAEDQLGPASPGVALFEEHGKLAGNTTDTGAARRIRPGTKAEDMAEGPPLVELSDVCSKDRTTCNVCYADVMYDIDRLGLPTHRTSQSPPLPPHPPTRLHRPPSHHRRHCETTLPASTQHVKRDLALRTRPLPHPKDQRHHRRPLRRHPSLLRRNLPRNASERMAVPLRRPRPA